MRAIDDFKKLNETFDEFSGGAIRFGDLMHMENIKPKDVVLYHVRRYTEIDDGKRYERKVIVLITERKI